MKRLALVAAVLVLTSGVAAGATGAGASDGERSAGKTARGGGERFGSDYDGDGFDDLAVGAPGEDAGSTVDAGNVTVLYGTGSGLTGSGAQTIRQGIDGVAGAAAAGATGVGLPRGGGAGSLGVNDLAVPGFMSLLAPGSLTCLVPGPVRRARRRVRAA